MLTKDNLLFEKPHWESVAGSIQCIYRFDNGYGLSVINGAILHSYPFAWEIAVLKNISEDGEKFELTYETSLTADVETFVSDEETNAFIKKATKVLSVL